MKKQDAIDHYGGVRALAEALEVWPQAIYKWGDEVPELIACKLQVMTDGKLKANLKIK